MSATATAQTPHTGTQAATEHRLTGLQEQIAIRKGLIGAGTAFVAALQDSGTVSFTGDNRWQQRACTGWTNILSIACGPDFILGLRTDGSVVSAGQNTWGQLDTDRWFCIRTVACGLRHTGAITQNGQVLCAGDNTHGQCNTQDWKSIVDLCCGSTFTVGLTAKGTVCIAGGTPSLRHAVHRWTQVVALFTDQPKRTVYAIDANGRLLSSRPLPHYATTWHSLVYVAATGSTLYGITADGALVSESHSRPLQKLLDVSNQIPPEENLGGWVACTVGHHFMAALRWDGRVICAGHNDLGQAQTADFVPCFTDYSSFCAQRQKLYRHQEEVNRHYQTRLALANRFKRWLACGEYVTAALHASGHIMATGKFKATKAWTAVSQLQCGNAHLLALHTDGTVSAAGNDTDGCCEVSAWKNVRTIAAGRYHSMAVTLDGTVLFAGQDRGGLGSVTHWKNVKSLCGNEYFTVGLCWDGRLLATRITDESTLPAQQITDWNARLAEIERSPLWQNVCQVVVSDHHVAALRQDGTVVCVGDATYRAACGITDTAPSFLLPWPLVRAIAAGSGYTVGLCYGGTVVAAGVNDCGQCQTQDWSQIVAVDCGDMHTVGLRADGHVLTCGLQRVGRTGSVPTAPSGIPDGYVPCQASSWQDVVAIRCGTNHTVAVAQSGHVYACGQHESGQCDVSSMILFHDIEKANQKGVRAHATTPTKESPAPERSTPHRATLHSDRATMPFQIQLPIPLRALREDAESWRSRIAGSTGHVSVLNDYGRVVSLVLDRNALITDVSYNTPFCAISAGSHHTAMLTHDGRVRIRNVFKASTPTMPVLDNAADLVGVSGICSGASYTALLLNNGRVRVVSTGRPLQFSADDWESMVGLSAGSWHLAGVRQDGSVCATGMKNRSLETTLDSVCPWDTASWTGISAVQCTPDATVGITPNGSVQIAGYATEPTDMAAACADWADVVSVASSGKHLVALREDGRVYAAGANQSGECNTQDWTNIIMIATRPSVTLGLSADGQVKVAGRCEFAANRLRGIRALFSFGGTMVFLTDGGDVLIQRQGTRKEPYPVRSLSLYTPDTLHRNIFLRYDKTSDPHVTARTVRARLSRGLTHAVYLDESDTVQAIGSNHYGQCQVYEWDKADAVSCGLYHTAALLKDGHVRLAGKIDCPTDAFDAFLSVPSDTSDEAASRVRYVAVGCGYHHTAAIRADGLVFAVGNNDHGQCAVQKIQNAIDLSCGVRHTAVLLADGQVRAVGDNTYGQCETDAWHDIVMTACGEFHTVGLRRDGTVVAAGSDAGGQCRLSDLTDVVSVACLADATVCVRADGSVIIRGNHHIPEETVSRLREILAVHACEYRLMAHSTDGRIVFHPQT